MHQVRVELHRAILEHASGNGQQDGKDQKPGEDGRHSVRWGQDDIECVLSQVSLTKVIGCELSEKSPNPEKKDRLFEPA